MRPTFKVTGHQSVVEGLTKVNVRMKEKARDVIKKVAFDIEGDAKKLVPVDTGRLRASISVNWTGSGMARGKVKGRTTPKPGRKPSSSTDGVGRPEDRGGFYAAVGTNVEYGPSIEHGGTTGGAHSMAPQPYLWPALAMNKAKLKAGLERALRMELARP
jgi:HK97 gp10 family phage protein